MQRRLAFAAPPLTRSGPVAEGDLTRVAAGLGMPREASWLVNGPDWIGVLLESAELVLAVRPDYAAMAGLKVGVVGPHPAGSEVGFEVRTFIPGDAAAEDPVTGSFNAGAAQWLIGSGRAPESYLAAQGTVLGRAGRVHIDAVGEDIWVGGSSVSCIEGFVLLRTVERVVGRTARCAPVALPVVVAIARAGGPGVTGQRRTGIKAPGPGFYR
ncbi:PhzF family phenazine biosynthesis protein [Pseudarthrobacter sp. ATCC 49987]|uniref:PhzF family phenazine biosynthesis protein n=1 Tax=Pseudarthrobacter sp. ATCC 49987 TaxID=2698204 RepID=UPI003FCE0B1F